jgi:hypothetical protein
MNKRERGAGRTSGVGNGVGWFFSSSIQWWGRAMARSISFILVDRAVAKCAFFLLRIQVTRCDVVRSEEVGYSGLIHSLSCKEAGGAITGILRVFEISQRYTMI